MHKRLGVHTPILMINALNNNLRIAVPIQIASTDDPYNDGAGPDRYRTTKKYLGVSTDIQIRYYTGIDAFNAIRIYFRYGQAGYKIKFGRSELEEEAQSVGFETRFYF